MVWSFCSVWDPVGNAEISQLFFLYVEKLFGKHLSIIWNIGPACLMWLVWQERNTRTFEDKERTLDHQKSLIFSTLFHWARIWGCTDCISLSEFLVSITFSSWLYCICFLFKVFTIVNIMFNFFSIKVLLPIKKKKWSFVYIVRGFWSLVVTKLTNSCLSN